MSRLIWALAAIVLGIGVMHGQVITPACTGASDDTASVQAAINESSEISLSGMTCIVSQIAIHDHTWLHGGILKQLPGYHGHMIVLSEPTDKDWSITNIELAGNWTSGAPDYGDGIHLDFGTDGLIHRGRISNCYVHNFGGNGIVLTHSVPGSGTNMISGCIVQGCALNGYVIATDDSYVDMCDSGQNGGDGFKISGWASRIVNCKAWMCGAGFSFVNTQGSTCIGLEYQKTAGSNEPAFLLNGANTRIATLLAQTANQFAQLVSQ
jgi:hypothetical protein